MTDNPPTPTPTRGAHDLWVGVVDAAHERIAGRIARAKTDHVAGILERVEADIAPHLEPLIREAVDNETLPPEVRDLLRAVIEPEHFTQSLLVGIAVGSILGPILGSWFQPLMTDIGNNAWLSNTSQTLSPAEAALAEIRHNPHLADPAHEAAMSGLNGDRFKAMVYNTGEPIAVGEGLQLYRRGLMDLATLQTLVHQSRIRDEWFDDVLNLRYAPPGAGEVLAARVKSHLTDTEAKRKLSEAGIDPDNYDWLVATAGRPPGIDQMLHLWNRGAATEADVEQAIAQSDINPHYTPFVKELRWYIPPVRSVMAMLRAGARTDAQATELFKENGVRPDDIPAYIAEGHHTRTAALRELSQSQVLRMYAARVMDRATAHARLVALRYPDADADLLLDFADDTRGEKLRDALITKVGALYTAHKLTKSEAALALNADAVPAEAQADLFHVWDIERTSFAPNLTVAQWQQALRRGLVTHDDFTARMGTFGYNDTEADLLAGLAFPPPKSAKAPPARDLSVSQIVKLYQAGNLTRTEAHDKLTALGYDNNEANEILILADK